MRTSTGRADPAGGWLLLADIGRGLPRRLSASTSRKRDRGPAVSVLRNTANAPRSLVGSRVARLAVPPWQVRRNEQAVRAVDDSGFPTLFPEVSSYLAPCANAMRSPSAPVHDRRDRKNERDRAHHPDRKPHVFDSSPVPAVTRGRNGRARLAVAIRPPQGRAGLRR